MRRLSKCVIFMDWKDWSIHYKLNTPSQAPLWATSSIAIHSRQVSSFRNRSVLQRFHWLDTLDSYCLYALQRNLSNTMATPLWVNVLHSDGCIICAAELNCIISLLPSPWTTINQIFQTFVILNPASILQLTRNTLSATNHSTELRLDTIASTLGKHLP